MVHGGRLVVGAGEGLVDIFWVDIIVTLVQINPNRPSALLLHPRHHFLVLKRHLNRIQPQFRDSYAGLKFRLQFVPLIIDPVINFLQHPRRLLDISLTYFLISYPKQLHHPSVQQI